MRQMFLGIPFLLVFVGCSSFPDKASVLDQVIQKKELRVGTTGDYKPFSFKDPTTGEFSGIDIDLAHHLAERLEARLVLVPTTWTTLMEDLKNEKFDIALSGITKNLQRQRTAIFSQGYHAGGKQAIGRCQDKKRFGSLKKIDRPDTRVVVNPGGTNEAFTRRIIKNAKIRVVQDNRAIFSEIAENRSDVMFTDSIEVDLQSRLFSKKLCSLNLAAFPSTLHTKAALLPRDWIWKQYIDTWINHLQRTKKLESIIDKHIKRSR